MAARPRLTSPFSGLSVIALSAAAGMSIELLAVRSAAFHFGASFPLWTAMIAVMLAGLAIGHPIGGFFASRYPARWIVAGCWVSAASSAALLPSLFGPLHASFGHLSLPWLSLLAAAISVGPAAIAFGIAVPAASLRALEQPPTPGKIRKPIRSRRARARIMGWIHAAGAAGSVAGTLFTGLVALPWMGSISASYALAALLLACAFATLDLVTNAMQRKGNRLEVERTQWELEIEFGFASPSRRSRKLMIENPLGLFVTAYAWKDVTPL